MWILIPFYYDSIYTPSEARVFMDYEEAIHAVKEFSSFVTGATLYRVEDGKLVFEQEFELK